MRPKLHRHTQPLLFAVLAAGSAIPTQRVLSHDLSSSCTTSGRIPSVHQSAIQGRRILHLASIGTLSTVFPTSDDDTTTSSQPSGLASLPIGLMEYVADCEPDQPGGNPTLLAIDIATNIRNAAAGSNATLSLRWQPPPPPSPHHRHPGAASLPRLALLGRLVDISEDEAQKRGIPGCYRARHPDAFWTPGGPVQPHDAHWARLAVEEVYWVGGFGDRAYIGWIPAEMWRGVSVEEVERCRLPFEREEDVWEPSE